MGYDKMFSVGQNTYFSEWLQAEMDKRDWSQSDCARAADLNRAVINKLLNGKCKPQPSTLTAIARAFKIPVEIAYRAAGLLPPSAERDDTIEQLTYIFNSIQSVNLNTVIGYRKDGTEHSFLDDYDQTNE